MLWLCLNFNVSRGYLVYIATSRFRKVGDIIFAMEGVFFPTVLNGNLLQQHRASQQDELSDIFVGPERENTKVN
jgi:hypothetical protein